MLELNQLRHVLSELFFISASDKNRDLSVAVRTNHLLALVWLSIKEFDPFTLRQIDLPAFCVFLQKRRSEQCIAKHILVLAGKRSFIFGPEERQRPHHRHIASHTHTGEENGNPMISFPYTKSAIDGTVAAFDDTVHKILKKDFRSCSNDPRTCSNCDFRYYCQK